MENRLLAVEEWACNLADAADQIDRLNDLIEDLGPSAMEIEGPEGVLYYSLIDIIWKMLHRIKDLEQA